LRACIFANGELRRPDLDRDRIRPNDLLIAADGGGRYCLQFGLKPTVLIGDFDSLDHETLEAFRNAGTEVIQHPASKDRTDLELAIRYACDHGADEILILGGLGQRWDQTLANLLLPAAPYLSGKKIRLVDGLQEIAVLRSGERLTIHGQPGDTVSLIPLSSDSREIATSGLKYSLNRDTLSFGSTRGISNVLLDREASIELGEGLLLCILIHANYESTEKSSRQ
jgi:thiamine pyrophosphokinase